MHKQKETVFRLLSSQTSRKGSVFCFVLFKQQTSRKEDAAMKNARVSHLADVDLLNLN